MIKMWENEYAKLPDAPLFDNNCDAMQSVLLKWRTIVETLEEGKIPDNVHSESCAFCKKYGGVVKLCINCPIRQYTLKAHCQGTPWKKFIVAHMNSSTKEELHQAERMLALMEEIAEHYGWVPQKVPSELACLLKEIKEIKPFDDVKTKNRGRDGVEFPIEYLSQLDLERLLAINKKYNGMLYVFTPFSSDTPTFRICLEDC